jgi:hypothetical protein
VLFFNVDTQLVSTEKNTDDMQFLSVCVCAVVVLQCQAIDDQDT